MLTVIGEALIDLVDTGDGRTYVAHPGGSPLNVAVGLARLGQETQLMARLSRDTFGGMLRGHAERNGVGLAAAVTATEASTLAVATLHDSGKARYDFYLNGSADWQWRADELVVPDGTQVLHTGSLASWLSPGSDRIVELLRRSRDAMLISYDPNVRPALLGTPLEGQVRVERAIACAHLVKASDEDIGWLYAGDAVAAVAKRWLDLGATAVVVTRGAGGASGYVRDRQPLHRAARPVDLVDTIGAGDAFTSGLLAALARAGVQDAAGLAATDLGAVLDEAVLVAALTCERAGADPPTATELTAARG